MCIVGESGCGKSTLLNIITGLFLPLYTVHFNTFTIRSKKYTQSTVKNLFSDHIAKTGYASQKTTESFDSTKKIREHFLINRDNDWDNISSIFSELGIHNIPEVIERYPFECSIGMLQRINICLSLYQSPDLIILDEITTGIDPINQFGLLFLLLKILRKQNITCIITTHDLRIAKLIADKVYVMHSGTFVESGKTEDVFLHPSHMYTKQLVNAYNKLHMLSI